MGNKLGNFASESLAALNLVAQGFVYDDEGYFKKPSRTTGNLMEAPRKKTAIVKISSYLVDGQYAADGKSYPVFQHHYI